MRNQLKTLLVPFCFLSTSSPPPHSVSLHHFSPSTSLCLSKALRSSLFLSRSAVCPFYCCASLPPSTFPFLSVDHAPVLNSSCFPFLHLSGEASLRTEKLHACLQMTDLFHRFTAQSVTSILHLSDQHTSYLKPGLLRLYSSEYTSSMQCVCVYGKSKGS